MQYFNFGNRLKDLILFTIKRFFSEFWVETEINVFNFDDFLTYFGTKPDVFFMRFTVRCTGTTLPTNQGWKESLQQLKILLSIYLLSAYVYISIKIWRTFVFEILRLPSGNCSKMSRIFKPCYEGSQVAMPLPPKHACINSGYCNFLFEHEKRYIQGTASWRIEPLAHPCILGARQ